MDTQKYHTKFDESFEELVNAITYVTKPASPNCKKLFRGHVDAIELAVGDTLKKIYDLGKYRVVVLL